ncbi:MAG: YdcH family protein [Alphaproteobacteria bacterium]|nr:YdcH family protein [Alphaproteobacteria bacterium]
MNTIYGVDSEVMGRISALKSRKNFLEQRIKLELKRPLPSNDVLTPLKLNKLHIKEEIYTLSSVA